jgi:hypothetical protein
MRDWIAQISGGTASLSCQRPQTHVCSRMVDMERGRYGDTVWDERDSWTATPNAKTIPSC